MNKKKLIKKPYFECESCKISTETIDRMCPCPRGGCDAIRKGIVIIRREIKLN